MNLTCEQCRLHHVSGGTSYCGIDRAPAYKPDSCRHDAIPDLLSDLAALESENAKLREVVEKLYNQSGLMGWLAMHNEGLFDELAEAAREATP